MLSLVAVMELPCLISRFPVFKNALSSKSPHTVRNNVSFLRESFRVLCYGLLLPLEKISGSLLRDLDMVGVLLLSLQPGFCDGVMAYLCSKETCELATVRVTRVPISYLSLTDLEPLPRIEGYLRKGSPHLLSFNHLVFHSPATQSWGERECWRLSFQMRYMTEGCGREEMVCGSSASNSYFSH